ncbi:Soluble quinoprotein glucose/sorbosone dehydrogenase [Modestobacter italicus]|uniref:Soluble quinoprotein glucose/sorbosone dehydrogenase n=1 Tax=Modestobacter italicus (strain DSM 44449 / CECT 9708 / BC 501) TaxID=2732864 RepID=I4F3X2_MODI5|nr:PQQ-dependent sugar dehydrogenase [Modestobacter marinus]CCH90335.1 Soluble quinoprotein glucose/sorbosone dehydrogenase [Modestobacter marinus]
MRRAPVTVGALVAAMLLAGCGSDLPGAEGDEAATDVPDSAQASSSAGVPALDVQVLADGLDHPWDVAQAPDGTLLVDERGGGFTAVRPDGAVRSVDADLDDLFATGETGLMGLVLDPAFADNRRFYTCQGVEEDGDAEIQVIAWTVDEGWTAATRVADPLLGGIPVNEGSGRHGGCRPRFDPTGQLLVGTGDNAVGSNPQDLGTLAGKVLRIDPQTGQPSAGNPFLDAEDPTTRLIWSYGHRNVQGIATQPGTQQVYTVEQGTDRDDEVNRSVAGGDYGYDPDGAPAGPEGSYDESVPMTDPDIPGAIEAVWSSGDPTIATSGATFLDGDAWGGYAGVLLVGVQKDTGVLGLRVDDSGQLVEQFRVPELEDSYGRVRSPVQGADGALYLTTDNGDGEDQLLKVTPQV